VALAVLCCELLQLMLDGFAEVIERALLVEEALSLAAAGAIRRETPRVG
jgi:hypothetical protein